MRSIGLSNWCVSLKPGDWVHCHCHGGDGRTTTFLALFDMVHWAKTKGTSKFPTVEIRFSAVPDLFVLPESEGCSETGKCKGAERRRSHKGATNRRLEILSRTTALVVPRSGAQLDRQWRAWRWTTIQHAARLGVADRLSWCCFCVNS